MTTPERKKLSYKQLGCALAALTAPVGGIGGYCLYEFVRQSAEMTKDFSSRLATQYSALETAIAPTSTSHFQIPSVTPTQELQTATASPTVRPSEILPVVEASPSATATRQLSPTPITILEQPSPTATSTSTAIPTEKPVNKVIAPPNEDENAHWAMMSAHDLTTPQGLNNLLSDIQTALADPNLTREQKNMLLAQHDWYTTLTGPMITNDEENVLYPERRGLGIPEVALSKMFAAAQPTNWTYDEKGIVQIDQFKEDNFVETSTGIHFYEDVKGIQNVAPLIAQATFVYLTNNGYDSNEAWRLAVQFANQMRWKFGLDEASGVSRKDINGTSTQGLMDVYGPDFYNVCEVVQANVGSNNPLDQDPEVTRRMSFVDLGVRQYLPYPESQANRNSNFHVFITFGPSAASDLFGNTAVTYFTSNTYHGQPHENADGRVNIDGQSFISGLTTTINCGPSMPAKATAVPTVAPIMPVGEQPQFVPPETPPDVPTDVPTVVPTIVPTDEKPGNEDPDGDGGDDLEIAPTSEATPFEF